MTDLDGDFANAPASEKERALPPRITLITRTKERQVLSERSVSKRTDLVIDHFEMVRSTEHAVVDCASVAAGVTTWNG